MALALDDRDRSLLAGERGAGAALAMRLVIRAAEALGADRLIPITRAHVDSCLYHGEATIDFARRLLDGGARVSVPTTLNVGSVDLLHPELWRGSQDVAERGRLLMDAYRRLGCRPTFTCAPYQLAEARPSFGEQVAWAESNAIAFCNSVIGARTERYGDFTDIACAIAGRVPDAGLHRTEARRAVLVLRPAADVPAALLDSEELYPVLGIVLGRRAGVSVAVLDGLPAGLSEDRLKAIGAAAAASGAVAMFHVVGSTPEAPTLAAALQGHDPGEVAEITLAELRDTRNTMNGAGGTSGAGARLSAVSLGTPHASIAELALVATLLDGKRVAADVQFVISTARDTLAVAEESGLAAVIRDAGVSLLVDTCSYVSPILREVSGIAMTDSAKWAHYAPGNIGLTAVLASTADCVASAVAGRVQRDESAWDGAPAA